MKKIAISFLLLLAFTAATNAQDYKKVRAALLIAQINKKDPAKLEAAKAELDKVIADPKAATNAETFLLKSEVLGSIAGDSVLKTKYPGADLEALEALKKYVEMEPSGEKMKTDNYAGLNEMSRSLSSSAASYFSAKNWDSSFAKFQYVVELSDLLIKNKWSASTFDTVSYLYAGATAQNAKKEDDAAKYYAQIADRKIAGKDYEGIYDYLTLYYLNKGDDVNFKKYSEVAKTLYPSNTLWSNREFSYFQKNASVDDKVKKYNDAITAGNLTAPQYIDYGDMFVESMKAMGDKPDSSKLSEVREKAIAAYEKAYSVDSSNGLVPFTIGTLINDELNDLIDRYRSYAGTSASLKAKRDAVDKQIMDVSSEAIVWFDKAYNILKNKATREKRETSYLNKSVDNLANLYSLKRDKSKGKNQKDVDAFDAQFARYDKEHGMYK